MCVIDDNCWIHEASEENLWYEKESELHIDISEIKFMILICERREDARLTSDNEHD